MRSDAPTPAAPAAVSALVSPKAAQRRREATAAANALGVAALMSILRATLLPLLLSMAPPGQFAALTSAEVQMINYLLAGAFVGLFFWARRDPLPATLAALALYLAWAVPDLIANPVLLGGGHLGKVVMLSVLGRAVSAGIMHRALKNDQMP